MEPDEIEQSQEKRQGPEIGALSLEREEREIGERREIGRSHGESCRNLWKTGCLFMVHKVEKYGFTSVACAQLRIAVNVDADPRVSLYVEPEDPMFV